MIPADSLIRRNNHVVCRALNEGAGILHLETNAFFALNNTGLQIWELLGDGVTVAELLAELQGAVASRPAHMEEEVQAFLDALLEWQLIEVAVPAD